MISEKVSKWVEWVDWVVVECSIFPKAHQVQEAIEIMRRSTGKNCFDKALEEHNICNIILFFRIPNPSQYRFQTAVYRSSTNFKKLVDYPPRIKWYALFSNRKLFHVQGHLQGAQDTYKPAKN